MVGSVPSRATPGPSGRSSNLRAIKRSNTRPEILVRSLLHKEGLRFRVDSPLRHDDRIAARPDIVFPRLRIAVFLDGCFWHGCPRHGRREYSRNAWYWTPKIIGNRERDQRQTALLTDLGWTVLRFWEHEDPIEIAEWISLIVRQRQVISSEAARPTAPR
jgi:DNA mismatch endonuclease, patch repair protein